MVRDYILLAVGSFFLGVLLALSMLAIIQRQGINIFENLWMLAIPAVLAVILNILLLEVYRKYRKKK